MDFRKVGDRSDIVLTRNKLPDLCLINIFCREDLRDDAIKASTYRIKNLQYLMENAERVVG